VYSDDFCNFLRRSRKELIGSEWIKNWIFMDFSVIIGLEWIKNWIKHD